MGNFFKRLFGKATDVVDSMFTEVSTSTEFDVEETIKNEVKQAIQATIDTCSEKYYRKIDVDFKISIK